MLACVLGVADHDDFAEIGEILARNGIELRQKAFAYDGDTRTGIVEDVFVVVRFGLRVDGDSDCANFYGTEEGVKEFGCVGEQEEHAFFRADTKVAKCVAGAVGVLEELLVGDTLFAAFNGDILRAALEDVAVHEIGSDVEALR